MKNNLSKYTYHYRPGYGSENLLIHFITGAENEDFLKDLTDATRKINPDIQKPDDLWINGEVVYFVKSDLGGYILTIDNWSYAFIMSDTNQTAVSGINDLLISDDRFTKVEVDFEIFRNIRTSISQLISNRLCRTRASEAVVHGVNGAGVIK